MSLNQLSVVNLVKKWSIFFILLYSKDCTVYCGYLQPEGFKCHNQIIQSRSDQLAYAIERGYTILSQNEVAGNQILNEIELQCCHSIFISLSMAEYQNSFFYNWNVKLVEPQMSLIYGDNSRKDQKEEGEDNFYDLRQTVRRQEFMIEERRSKLSAMMLDQINMKMMIDRYRVKGHHPGLPSKSLHEIQTILQKQVEDAGVRIIEMEFQVFNSGQLQEQYQKKLLAEAQVNVFKDLLAQKEYLHDRLADAEQKLEDCRSAQNHSCIYKMQIEQKELDTRQMRENVKRKMLQIAVIAERNRISEEETFYQQPMKDEF